MKRDTCTQKETVEIYGIHDEERGLVNWTLTRHNEGKRSREKHRVTCITCSCKGIVNRDS